VIGAEREPTARRLARGHALFGALDAVIDGVADRVHERVLDGFDDRTIELGAAALELDVHGFAADVRQIPHDARKARPDVADRLHARLHHAGLELGREQVQALRRVDEPRVVRFGAVLEDLVAREHELAHEVHDAVEQGYVDADRGLGDARGARLLFAG
jgi:hypothetical protein